jgi:alginate O-acetyltransferase complex protein AlgI
VVFSSIEFLFAFLPAALGLYFLAPRRLRNATLLAISLLFYAFGSGALVGILLVSIVADYGFGRVVGSTMPGSPWRRAAITGSVMVNLAILGSFKYVDFGLTQWNGVAGRFGATPIELIHLSLPVGISFYTFQSMSYVIDLARGRAQPRRDPVGFALFVALFPQLVAGPIVRFHEIADQIRERRERLADVAEGALRFGFGLCKKVIVADTLAPLANAAFELGPEQLSPAVAWLGLLAYTLQIYFDFSGYSDMAIGLGRVFGFRLPENFARPYSALSITDFWRRWHISLSAWFRDYLYVPLGGSRRGPTRTYLNLAAVFVLVGLWHGAAWTFIAWGMYHGALLVAERAFGWRRLDASDGSVPYRAFTFLAVMLGWVLFRASDLTHAADYASALAGWGASETAPGVTLLLSTRVLATLALGSLVPLLPRDFSGGRLVGSSRGLVAATVRISLLAAVPYALVLVMSGTFSPFLYFQF